MLNEHSPLVRKNQTLTTVNVVGYDLLERSY